ncbi:hypothetical protein PTKIN_Ptkin12aG0119400 [Pterospermum kingtungense]
MAASVDTQSPSATHLTKEPTSLMASSSPLFSPASDKRFWSTLRSRVDALIDDRNAKISGVHNNAGESSRGNRLKEDSLLLLRGFDSISQTLSQLSNNLDNALQVTNFKQLYEISFSFVAPAIRILRTCSSYCVLFLKGARELAKPPTLTDIFHSNLKNSEAKEEDLKQIRTEEDNSIGRKRKYDSSECSDEHEGDGSNEQQRPEDKKTMKKVKNLAISMATKAASLARELKSIKSDLCFMQERCGLLEEENRRLRDGFTKGIRPEEDDLVRLQLEALLAEKSRLANENANLVRENQCLHQLVEYHQMTSQDLSASYEEVIRGMCLDFSSPIVEEEEINGDCDDAGTRVTQTPPTNISSLWPLDEFFDEAA